jgi:amino acid adenylation domain-containing protein
MPDLAKFTETLSPKKRELLDLLLKEKKRKAESAQKKGAPDRIPRREKFSPGPVSFAQQRLWFIDQLDPGTPAFNIPAAIRLRGFVDVNMLKRCFDEIVSRHETLRTSFASEDGMPVQVIAPAAEFRLPVVDLRELTEGERMKEVQTLVTRDCQRSFDLTRCPLMRATLVLTGEKDQVLILMMHHIIGDVWSVRVAMRELATLYEAFASKRPSPLPELPIQYCDYAIWQREWLQGEVLQSHLAYWKQKLTGMPEELELPTDRPRPPVQSIWGAKHFLKISREAADALRAIGQQEKASLFMTLLATWKVLLHRYTGQEDIVVGAPVANRNRSEFESLVGFFVNSLILRTDLSGDPTFRELLKRVRETTLGAFSNQDFPFERLVELLQPTRNMSRNPLFQTDFILQNSPRSSYQVTGLSFEPLPVENGTAQLDLTLDLWEESDGIGGWLEYDTDLFNGSTAARIVSHYINMLEGIVREPDRPISHCSLMTQAELQQITFHFNDTSAPFDLDSSFQLLFQAQVLRSPHSLAVACGPAHLSYLDLNLQANSLAHSLILRGIGPDSVVAILLHRGIPLLTSIIAILKAGAAYLPLDPSHPPQRLLNILDQSRPSLVLSSHEFIPSLSSALSQSRHLPAPQLVAIEDLDDLSLLHQQHHQHQDPPPRSLPDNLAYVIFTSGSTGTPKGVMIHQRGMLNHLLANITALAMTHDDVLAQTASQCFDISVWQFLAPLIIGARVQIFTNDITQDPARLLRQVDAEQVTIFETVPSILLVALSQLCSQGPAHAEQPPRLQMMRWVLPTGEEVSAALCRVWFNHFPTVPLMNAYGPSECSDDVTLEPIFGPPPDSQHRMPIGRPVANLQVAIVDRWLNPAPVGVPGELCVRGVGVGRGYLGMSDRTAGSFVPDPFSEDAGARMYRSGDRARYLEDGRIEFLGRMDYQVKVRGFRIELGEIEAVMGKVEGVREAVVIVREDEAGEARLVGYVVWEAGKQRTSAEMRDELREQLPDYMVPVAVVGVEAMPLTANGKIDRKALPLPDGSGASDQNFVEPRDPTEEVLTAMWAEILSIERIGVEDNLFERGAHSLLVTQVLSRIRKIFKVEPPLRLFFECPTIAGMARSIEKLQSEAEGIAAPPIVPILREGHLPLSFTQERMWFLDQLEPGLTAYNVPGAVYLNGYLNSIALQDAFSEILRRHEILRTTYDSVDGKPIQIIHPAQPFRLPIVDLRPLPEDECEAVALQLARSNAQQPFDLAQGPMLRCFLVHMRRGKHLLAMTTHHIAYDMWSREIFIFELATLYQAFVKGEPSPLPEPEIQWVDYAYWQREWLRGEVLEKHLDYWRRKLSEAPSHLDLQTDLPRPPVQSYRGARQYLQLPPELARGISALSKKHGVTPFITILAAFKTLLFHYTGQDQIVVGSPIANRNRLELEKLMGFLANTLVLYTDLSGNPTFTQLLERVRETALGAHAHQDVPFEFLVQTLQPQRDMSRSPLFQVMFNYMLSYSSPKVDLPDLTLRLERLHSGAAQFEINVDMWETDDGLNGVVEYCTDLFYHSTITRFVTHLRVLLEGIVREPDRPISHCSLLSDAELQQVISHFNDTSAPFDLDSSFQLLFQAQVLRSPHSLAVACGPARLSYLDLNLRANSLSHSLILRGLGPDSVVAILLHRGIPLLSSIIAILKTGAAYLPLDPSHPPQRLLNILDQSRPSLVLSSNEFLPSLSSALSHSRHNPAPQLVAIEDLDDLSLLHHQHHQHQDPPPRSLPDNLAYVIFTSGSTGSPKGVMIHQRGMLNHLCANITALAMTDRDVLAQTASQCFDISVWQFLAPLIIGARVQIFTNDITQDPTRLLRQVDAEQVTIFETVPSILLVALSQLCSPSPAHAEQPPRLQMMRWVLPTGEEVSAALCRVWFNHFPTVPLMNAYGPSECSDDVTLEPIFGPPPDSQHRMPIGRPVANLQVAIADRWLNPAPVGVPGELCVRGVGVGRGYLGMSDRTAGSFVPDPFGEDAGARMYRSGDRARYLEDGRIEFLGRMDYQVKVRGFRIELGEVEAVMGKVEGVREAVVIVREDEAGEARLVGYVVWEAGRQRTSAEMRDELREQLPDYMVPVAIVGLEAMPLTANGKIDRKALPAPGERSQVDEGTRYEEPQTELEQTIAEIWSQILGVKMIGLNDDFFDLGGHSLLAVQFISRLRDRVQVEVPLKTFFEYSTVAGMARMVCAIRWAVQGLESPFEAVPGEEEGVL